MALTKISPFGRNDRVLLFQAAVSIYLYYYTRKTSTRHDTGFYPPKPIVLLTAEYILPIFFRILNDLPAEEENGSKSLCNDRIVISTGGRNLKDPSLRSGHEFLVALLLETCDLKGYDTKRIMQSSRIISMNGVNCARRGSNQGE